MFKPLLSGKAPEGAKAFAREVAEERALYAAGQARRVAA